MKNQRISAICCGIKNYLTRLISRITDLPDPDLPVEGGYKKKKNRNAIIRYTIWNILISDRAILASVTTGLDSDEIAMVGLNSNSPFLPEHHHCFKTGHCCLSMIDLWLYRLTVTIPANLVCMYICMYIYTEMHRFGRNAENPEVFVYKEKRKPKLWMLPS